MKEFDFFEFHNNLKKDFDKANIVIDNLEKNRYRNPDYYWEENMMDEENLESIFEKVILKIKFVYEYLDLKGMSEILTLELKEYEGKFKKLVGHPVVDILYSPVQWILQKHVDAITSHVKIADASEIEFNDSKSLLERILRGTAKILTDRRIEPSNEAEVRNEVFRMLIHVFPDTVREIPIAKVSKTYKPDIGVKSIKSAIEYKFVDSEQEAKTAIGGIFEDIQGYEGSEDWKTFYAIIYMTDYYMTQDQVIAEFKLSKVPHHWKPIVVFGKGNRKKRKKTVPNN